MANGGDIGNGNGSVKFPAWFMWFARAMSGAVVLAVPWMVWVTAQLITIGVKVEQQNAHDGATISAIQTKLDKLNDIVYENRSRLDRLGAGVKP